MNVPQDLVSKDLKAVFIDLDGTLVDSLPRLYEIYLAFLNGFGIKGSLAEFDEINGPSLSEVVRILKARHHLPVTIQELIHQYQGQVYRIYEDETLLMEGALDTMRFLKEKHLKLILVTSATRDFVSLFLTHFHLNSIFHHVISGDMVKRGKPDPEIYQLALHHTKLQPEETLVIEDSANGVKSATAAGIFTLRLNKKANGIHWHQGWADVHDWQTIQSVFQEWHGKLSDD